MALDLSGLGKSEEFRIVRPAVFFGANALVAPLERLSEKDLAWSSLLRDAAEGARSVTNAASLPYLLSWRAEVNRRFGHIHAAEQIMALPLQGGEPTAEARLEARKKAEEIMDASVNSPEGQREIITAVFNNLRTQMDDAEISGALKELLIQTEIAIWSLFETFASSFVISWLNTNPHKVKAIMTKPELRTFFGKPTIDIEVSAIMGSI